MFFALIILMCFFQLPARVILLIPQNVTNIILQNAYVIVLAVGMRLCIISGGNIDLSVGSAVALIGAILGVLLSCGYIFIAIKQGAGTESKRSFILKLICIPAATIFSFVWMGLYGGVSYMLLIVICLVIIYSIYSGKFISGRHIYAMGGNAQSASMMTYTISNNPYQSMAFLMVNDDTQHEYGEPEKSAKMKAIAEQNGWLVISMRDDFKTIYGENVTKKAD